MFSYRANQSFFYLVPPFSPNDAVCEDPVLPGVYQKGTQVVTIDQSDADSVKEYMRRDLDVSRLNEIHKHLWLAGLPQVSRALHNQIRVGRHIHITERADLHLVWRDNVLYVKPLPDHLLSHSFWAKTICTDSELFENAKGFLYSYTWLICSKSDLRIAHDQGLLSDAIRWEQWAPFSAAVVSHVNKNPSDINPRYIYGELRLTRLNSILRFCSRTSNFKTMIRGYEYGYHQYGTYFEKNYAWVLTSFVYITVVLTAMQVGLATTELNRNEAFSRASYVFTMFSIFAPVISLIVGIVIVLLLAVFNVRYALKRREQSHDEFSEAFRNTSVRTYNH